MNNTYSASTATDNNNLRSAIFIEAPQLISNTVLSAEKDSKEKYAIKTKLIENAEDMSNQEKLDALDKNYERRNQENWQNIAFAFISLVGLGLIACNPSVIKNVRNLMVA